MHKSSALQIIRTWSTGTFSKSPSIPLRLSARNVNLGLLSGLFATRKLKNSYPKAHESHGEFILLGYHFRFVQSLIPETDEQGQALKFYPQELYKHKSHRKLNKFGSGAFCHFSITADNLSGVYLLVADGELLYIGETYNLNQRFNNRSYGSYGFITPAACYEGGQITNCKINKLVLKHFEAGNPLRLYFIETEEHKQVERVLLQSFVTPFNVSNN